MRNARARHPLFLAAALLAALASPAVAQEPMGAIGYGAGAAWFSPFNRGSGASTLDLGPGWVLAAHVDQWIGDGRLGGRLGGSFTQRPLNGAAERRQINFWALNASGMLRPLPPGPLRPFAPFLSAGLGVVSYGLGEGVPVVIPEAATLYPGGGERQVAALIGAGLDLFPRLSWHEVPLGIRLELTDQIARESPFERIGGAPYGAVHNITLTLGIHGRR